MPKFGSTIGHNGFFVMFSVVVADAAVVIGAASEVIWAIVVIGSMVVTGGFELVVVVVDANSHLTSFSRLQNPLVWSKYNPWGHVRIMNLLFTHLFLNI